MEVIAGRNTIYQISLSNEEEETLKKALEQ